MHKITLVLHKKYILLTKGNIFMSYSSFTYSTDIPTNSFLHVNNCATLLLNDIIHNFHHKKGFSRLFFQPTELFFYGLFY